MRVFALVIFFLIWNPGECPGESLHKILFDTARQLSIDPPAALNVLAEAESGVNPLAIHLSSRAKLDAALKLVDVKYSSYTSKGRYHYSVSPGSKAKAAALVRWADKHDHISYDVGMMQIWEGNVRRYGLDPVRLLDPHYNALIGGEIFRKCLNRYNGSFWRAVECYHHGSYKGRPTYYSRNVGAAINSLLAKANR